MGVHLFFDTSSSYLPDFNLTSAAVMAHFPTGINNFISYTPVIQENSNSQHLQACRTLWAVLFVAKCKCLKETSGSKLASHTRVSQQNTSRTVQVAGGGLYPSWSRDFQTCSSNPLHCVWTLSSFSDIRGGFSVERTSEPKCIKINFKSAHMLLLT